MSNQQAIEILDEMIFWFQKSEILQTTWGWNDNIPISKMIEQFKEAKSRIQSLPDTDEWISADNPPEEVQMKQILAYEIDERRWIITATFYDGKWLRDDNENICFFDFWKELPTPPITK